VSVSIVFLNLNDLIIDVIGRPCMRQEDLQTYDTPKRAEFMVSYSNVFRLGSRYLNDKFGEDRSRLVLFMSIF
jgi:hypothetical protein